MTTGDVGSPSISTFEDEITSALIDLMNRYQDQLYAFLVVLLHDRDAALDCAQDTFLRAYQHLGKGKVLTGPWLYKVARNRAMDELKRRQRLRAQPEEWERDEARVSDEGEVARDVRRALSMVSPAEREILYLAEVDGFTSKEIGQMLGLRPGAVRMRLFRAHARFRDAYGDPR